MSERYKLTVGYEGTHYVGWQIQANGISVQARLKEALEHIAGQRVTVIGAGRTDAGVHAVGQAAHVDLDWRHTPSDLQRALNSLLPADIRVQAVEAVAADFHAQRSARSKWYRYLLYEGETEPLFARRFCWCPARRLNLAAMKRAGRSLKGRHDFASFQGSGASVKTTLRTLHRLSIRRDNTPFIPFFVLSKKESILDHSRRVARGVVIRGATTSHENELRRDRTRPPTVQNRHPLTIVDFIGDGFLKQMVRNLVGTLVEVGRGERPEENIPEILRARDRKKAGHCAPPRGLFLMKVVY